MSCLEASHQCSSPQRPSPKRSTTQTESRWKMWPNYGRVFANPLVAFRNNMASDTFSVYALNRTHIEDDASARLENFFWRIWSNPNIIRSIRGNNLARMFISISQGGNRVRTTPVQSPFSTAPPSVCSGLWSPRVMLTGKLDFPAFCLSTKKCWRHLTT